MSNRKYIATRLQAALEIAPDEPLLLKLAAAPHYVIDRRLVEMLGREDVQKTVRAMIEAEVARLPFPELGIEFEDDNGVRRFVYLEENNTKDGFLVSVVTLKADAMTLAAVPARISLAEERGLEVQGHASELDGLAAGFAAAISLLMLNTRGIEKERIEPTKLNKARGEKGKPRVPTHTVVRIGTVVDRDGKEIRADQARMIPVHLRAGHAKRQFYGPERSLRKVIYIPPVLVNFKPDDDASAVPQPKKVITR